MATDKELLANALKRKEELERESKILDELIANYRRNDAADAAANETVQLGLWDKHGAKRRLEGAKVGEMLDEARRLILTERRPLKRGELVSRLEDRGYEVIGTDKNKVFGTNVWRSGRFLHVPGEGYWPKDVELPDGSS